MVTGLSDGLQLFKRWVFEVKRLELSVSWLLAYRMVQNHPKDICLKYYTWSYQFLDLLFIKWLQPPSYFTITAYLPNIQKLLFMQSSFSFSTLVKTPPWPIEIRNSHDQEWSMPVLETYRTLPQLDSIIRVEEQYIFDLPLVKSLKETQKNEFVAQK